MNRNELTNHLIHLARKRPTAEPTITWHDWFTHCERRTDYAANRIRHHRRHPTTAGAELLTWGVVATSLADNNRSTHRLTRCLTDLWQLASTQGELNRDLHPVDHLLSLASQRTRRNDLSGLRHHRIAQRLADEPQPNPDPTAAAALANVTLAAASNQCEALTGHNFRRIATLAFATGTSAADRQRLRRSRQRLQTLVAA